MRKNFNSHSFLLRFLFALALVFITYNPSGYSFYHWASDIFYTDATVSPPFALLTILILIGWTIYLRATLRSLGGFGLLLAFTFFAILIWWLVDLGWLNIDRFSVLLYLILVLTAAVLAVGMSWSYVRRRLTGQTDVDDIDD